MARHLSSHLGTIDPNDNLFSGLDPVAIVSAGTIKATGTAFTLKRGTVLAKGSDGKLVILGTTPVAGEGGTTPAAPIADCVLSDDVNVGASTDEIATVYISGCFNDKALIVKDGYTMSAADKDKLRERNIYLRSRWA